MRTAAFVILIALLSTVLVPSVIILPGGTGDGEVSIGLLDVCHKSLSGISPDLPFLSVCPCIIEPVAFLAILPHGGKAVMPRLLSRVIEEPPVLLS
jgi:hypothetical protein